jgi:hypothetical protein
VPMRVELIISSFMQWKSSEIWLNDITWHGIMISE